MVVELWPMQTSVDPEDFASHRLDHDHCQLQLALLDPHRTISAYVEAAGQDTLGWSPDSEG